MAQDVDPFAPHLKWRWGSIFFFLAVNLTALIAAPYWAWTHGVSRPEAALFVFYVIATSLAITVGYHRLYTHRSFDAAPAVHFLALFFGAAAFEQSAFKWASQHRTHHRFVDTDRDPYNIQRGFFYAHVGWILFWKRVTDYANVAELEKNALVKHQHEHYRLWSIGAGVVLPVFIGGLTGHAMGAFLYAVAARLFIGFHSTFMINSFAHTFGSQPFDATSSARDHWLGSVLTNGEGYHNYHHRFPVDYRNGVLWHHWDPGKWTIFCLSKLGLAYNLKRTAPERIREARLETARIFESRIKAA